MNTRIFDAHCDTLVKSRTAGSFTGGGSENHVDLPRLLESGVIHQVMAICTEPYSGREKEIWQRGIENFAGIRVTEKPVLHFAIEGCLPIHEGWEVPFHPLVASLTWNGDNPYAGGIGSTMDLTDKGRKLVKRFLADNTAIDISHLNSRSRKSLLSMGHRVCATHCNAARLCSGRNRNLPDEDLTEIAGNGGVIGVTFVPDFLTDQKGMATIESVVDHVEYIAERTSTDSVGFGSDFDGIRELPAGITGAESWYRVIDALENRGWSQEDIEKVACGNWLRFFNL